MDKDGLVRPDVEQISEGLRVPPHRVRDYREHRAFIRRRLWDLVWTFILAALMVAGFALLFTAWAETGEACPGAPEGWLGYCSALEDR